MDVIVIMENIGQRLREIRESKKLTLTEVAKMAGISQGSLSFIENEKNQPTVETIRKILSAMGLTLADFFANDLHLPEKIKDFVSKKENHGIIYLIMQMKENKISGELMTAWLKDLLATIEAGRKKYSNRVGIIVMPGQQPGRDYDPEEVEYLRKELENELSDLILTPNGIKKP